MHHKLSLLFLSLLFLCSLTYAQTEVTLTPDKDNTLYESATGSVSNGAGVHFFVGNNSQSNTRRGLLSFDMAANIPEGSVIQSVTLTLYLSMTRAGDEELTLHRVLANWGEGTTDAPDPEGQGGDATPGSATWIHTFFDTSSWTNQGGDFSDVVSATQSVGANGFYTWGSTDEMVADVQSWLDNPGENDGWILIGNESTGQTVKRFDTKENPDAENRPVLTVTYMQSTVVNEPDELPTDFSLSQNYPNPFNPSTKINYRIPTSANLSVARLEIYNLLGQKIRTLLQTNQPSGSYTATWNGKNDAGQLVPSGYYIYRLNVGELSDTRTMILLR